MNTNDFNKPITAAQLNETMYKQFGSKINLDKYTREDLENYRNLLRTKLNQTESSNKFNDLLTNETYQRDQYILKVLNTKIKEMLGESIKIMEKAVSKAQQQAAGIALAAKRKGKKPTGKGAAAQMADMPAAELEKFASTKTKKLPKHKKTDESMADKDYDQDGTIESEKDEYQGSRIRAAKKAGKMEETMATEAKKKPSVGMTKKEKSATVKAAKSGKDIGKPGKGFEKVEAAAKKGGAKDPKAVAAAAMWKTKAKKVKESVERMIMEDEEGKAKTITAGIDMINDFTSWMQRVGQFQSKTLVELADDIKANFGAAEAESFKRAVIPALEQTFDALTQSREMLSHAVDVLAGQEEPTEPMGMEPEVSADTEEFPVEPVDADSMNAPEEDIFAASDAAAGGAETAGRERREGKEIFAKKLQESHNIMTILSK